MQLNNCHIEDACCEAFAAQATRLIITARDEHWARAAAREATGYASSIIGCDAEAGIERVLSAEQTPDGRPGVAIMLFNRKPDALIQATRNRAGQCLMTCPTTAVFDGMPESTARYELGSWLGFFGDGHQRVTGCHDRTVTAIPVLDGEFFAENTAGHVSSIAGGVLYIGAGDQMDALDAAAAASHALESIPGIITPFPYGICRAASKVGSRYRHLIASTNEVYCPTLRAQVVTRLPDGVNALYEIVIDALDREAMLLAIRQAITAAAQSSATWISAPSFDGKLGQITFHLREAMQST